MMAKAGIKAHIAVLPSPGIGHVTPLLELSKLLASQHECDVSFLNVTTECSAAQKQLLQSPNLPSNIQVIDIPAVDLSSIVNDETPVLTRLCLNLRESLRPLNAILSQLPHKPQAMIIDMFGTQVFDSIPDNIPVFTFFTASAHLLAFSLFLPQLDRDVQGEFVDLPNPVQSRPHVNSHFTQHVARSGTPHKALAEHPFYRSINTPPLYLVGPLIKESEPVKENEQEECLAWLDKQPAGSVLFVTFGSGGVLSWEQQIELAWGLELSGVRFLWVVRAPNEANASAAFFKTGGDDAKETWMNGATVEEELGVGVRVRVNRGGGLLPRDDIERVVRMVMDGEEGKQMKLEPQS
ncbi:hypothetical protein VNO78_10689 [Psophocarpus tetragonolobus]|uniref:Uncharacterized protein n=1 Tax=Psophocarpus tetragonolobus TaxID=3891 RepID=A0AAN9XMY9_PSOTE